MSERDTESTGHENKDMLEISSPMVGVDHVTADHDSLYLHQRGSGETLLTFPSEEPITPGEVDGSNGLQMLSDEESTLSSNLIAFYEAYRREPQPYSQDCIRSLSVGVGSSSLASSEILPLSQEDLGPIPSMPGHADPRDEGFPLPTTYVDNSNLFGDKDGGRVADELAHAIITLQRQKDQLCTHAKQRLEATMSLYDFGVLFGILSPQAEFRQLLKDAHSEFCALHGAPTPPPRGPVID
ncbi:hypothetical protein BO94DRAFT_584682 [Aspergillus sclerotioniger CBS 115572]|uniref:Uncharacterized protein n=1 Tax=Aspergillus sclerotioniger CBS 115572 TaxID=1450535 RepID=A0A317WYX4_9EURO|nr:hypothetical protein BO94DRAFT_584682 [Aspergillus sclerotioniger CBS 115572]PWY89420.1 hypothetical protein BO94DRAFT_584682 [Aspergillus sclerotioniger CBS 115572]